jgi:hypothetical protein
MNGLHGIDYHRTALLEMVTGLFALAGFLPGGVGVSQVSMVVRSQILRVLRPAETATRRLVLYLANRVVLVEPKERVALRKIKKARKDVGASSPRAPVFRLYDRWKYFPELANPRKRVSRGPGPRIWLFDGFDHLRNPTPPAKPERDPDDAVRLCRRMQALHRALSDMPAQAKRLKRGMARREKAPPGPGRCGPMRPGLPPGARQNRTHAVDELLSVCHRLAWRDDPPYDTS